MNIMEFALLRNDCNEQLSPISDGVVEIQIYIYIVRENLTT
jgi:hypothetical protein